MQPIASAQLNFRSLSKGAIEHVAGIVSLLRRADFPTLVYRDRHLQSSVKEARIHYD